MPKSEVPAATSTDVTQSIRGYGHQSSGESKGLPAAAAYWYVAYRHTEVMPVALRHCFSLAPVSFTAGCVSRQKSAAAGTRGGRRRKDDPQAASVAARRELAASL